MSAPTTTRRRRMLVSCARCGPAGAGRPHAHRGLCKPCADAVRADGTLEDWPRLTMRSRDLVEDACLLRARYGAPRTAGGRRVVEVRAADGTFAPGVVMNGGRDPDDPGRSWPQIAEMLGVSVAALEKARQRCGWPDPTKGRPVREPGRVRAGRVSGGGVAA